MSSTDIILRLTYPNPEHTRLVLEAFEFWPHIRQKHGFPTPEQIELTESRMKALGYYTPQLFNYTLFDPSCILEYPASLEGDCIKLDFYCSKTESDDFWNVVFDELSALPVKIDGYYHCDMSDYEQKRTVVYD
ncbi:hypothetical protein [uncultured Paraglaciecola sp.]|uniref:hypothetical protein n=1 Tax=uncultured Paraglaciecola sp. TaxID=1765024 RepID=UPI002592C9A3|nr:hypothetical protein [uncultured Paraglaciecola sp.]